MTTLAQLPRGSTFALIPPNANGGPVATYHLVQHLDDGRSSCLCHGDIAHLRSRRHVLVLRRGHPRAVRRAHLHKPAP